MQSDKHYESFNDLFKRYTLPERSKKTERGELVKEIAQYTGFTEGYIRFRTKGMQDPATLRFILSSMKNVPKAKDAKHAFNTVMFIPKPVH